MAMSDVTGMVVFGTLLAVALYDVLAIVRGGVVASVSQFTTNCSTKPRIAFVCGALCCHLFGWMMVPWQVPQDALRTRMFISGAACCCKMDLQQCETCQELSAGEKP